MAGTRGKIRDKATLDNALRHFGGQPMPGAFPEAFPDHAGDAVVTAAGLRAIADQPRWWSPPGLETVAHNEGWTFGIA